MRQVQATVRSLVVLAIVLALVAPSAKAAAEDSAPQSAPASVAEPIVLEPTRILDAKEPGEGEWHWLTINEPIAFSPDGRELYTYRPVIGAVNVWALLVYFWPEVLGSITGFIGLAFLVMLVRVLRRPRERGLPYCRRCNYCLEKCESERCPECGVRLDRRRPVRGRRFIWRTAPVLSVFMLVGGVYSALWIAGVNRDNDAQHWFGWWSDALGPIAESHKESLWYCDCWGDRLLAIDTRTGEERIIRTASEMDVYLRPVVAPDGRSIFIQGRYPSRVKQVDVRNGRIMRVLRPPGEPDDYGDLETLAGISFDSQYFYATCADGGFEKTLVIEWDLKTRTSREIMAVPGEPKGNWVELASLRLVPGREAPLFLDGPVSLRDVMLWDPQAPDQPVATLPTAFWQCDTSFSPDGDVLYVHYYGQPGVEAYDSTTLAHLKTIAESRDLLSVEAGGSYLLLASEESESEAVVVQVLSARDDGRVLARLVIPPGMEAEKQEHLLAPDGSHACVRCWTTDGEYIESKLLLYDLAALGDGSH